jgi:hypothetical protein
LSRIQFRSDGERGLYYLHWTYFVQVRTHKKIRNLDVKCDNARTGSLMVWKSHHNALVGRSLAQWSFCDIHRLSLPKFI